MVAPWQTFGPPPEAVEPAPSEARFRAIPAPHVRGAQPLPARAVCAWCDDLAAGDCLTCQAVPLSDLVLKA